MSARALYDYRDWLQTCGLALGVAAVMGAAVSLVGGLLYLGWLALARLTGPLGVHPARFWLGLVLALFVLAGVLLALSLLVERAADGRAGE